MVLLQFAFLAAAVPVPEPTSAPTIGLSPRICKKGGSGFVLPAGGEDHKEYKMPALYIVGYFFGLIWLFLAVGIISDVFMDAIEEITSAEKEYPMRDGTKKVFKVWNATVANLTLMALGSSAPEILLSVIEIMGADFYAGELGPSTIVGSAAFNLFVIIAVCVIAIPEGDPLNPDGRKIADYNVFTVTGFFSIFAYVWLLFILLVTSPEVCEFWEGLLTFLYFPVLVALAYAADKGYFSKRPEIASKIIPSGDMSEKYIIKDFLPAAGGKLTQQKAAELLTKLNTTDLSPKEAAVLVRDLNIKSKGPPSRALLRRQAIRQLVGGKRVVAKHVAPGLMAKYRKGSMKATVFFGDETGNKTTKYGVLENDGVAKLSVHRVPKKGRMTINYETADIAGEEEAEAGKDYEAKKGQLIFEDGVDTQTIEIPIINDDEVEKDERFLVRLSNCDDAKYDLGENGEVIAEVTIIDDDEPGEIGMAANADDPVTLTAQEGSNQAVVTVRRFNGSSGKVSCKWKTEKATSLNEKETPAEAVIDYKHSSGELTFEATEMAKQITIPIIDNKSQIEKKAVFAVTVYDCAGPVPERSAETGNMTAKVVIVSQHEANQQIIEEVMKMDEADEEKFNGEQTTWLGQFSEALEVELEDDQEVADMYTLIMHWISVPWKLLFATCPPAHYYGGYPCFVWSLAYIGGVTMFIGDLAALFGCALGIPDSTTAITFVALGTSLPDTLASKAAAESDETADAAIGNVTGSNAVNVFLGIGLPWTIAAVRWQWMNVNSEAESLWNAKYKDNKILMKLDKPMFAVPAGSLGTSVLVFCLCAACCFATLVYRRKYYGFELGGPEKPAKRHAVFLVGLWVTYIVVSIITT